MIKNVEVSDGAPKCIAAIEADDLFITLCELTGESEKRLLRIEEKLDKLIGLVFQNLTDK